VSGTELKAQSSTKQKTLEPRWCEVFSFEYTPGSDSENPPVLDVLVEDIDTVSSADFMGRAKVELAPLKNQRLRKWFPLSADSEGKKGSSNVTGDLELVVQWRHNPALAFAPFADAVEDVPEGKKPNELRVAAIQARRLAVKDKSMMGKGTSDPVVTFELGSVKAETTVKKKTLNPTWKEAFAKPCSVEEAQDCQLKISVGDWDAVTSRDFMGSCVIDLKGCVEAPNKAAVRRWCLLDLDESKKTQNVSGEVEIWYQWRYNPLLDFEPFTDVSSDKPPNVLRVGVSQGRGLKIMDKNMLSKGGTFQCP
jgi:Ca2+-dependent lipid-binding protein